MQEFIVCDHTATSTSDSQQVAAPTIEEEELFNEDGTQEQCTTTSIREEILASSSLSQTEPSSQRRPPAMNTTNLRTNDVFGQDLQLPKSQGVSRFLSLNINGMRRANEFQDGIFKKQT
jgi:hypothetical protein